MRSVTLSLRELARAAAPALLAALPLTSGCNPSPPGSAERGRVALHQHACQTCHTIPGVVGSNRQIGPPLAGFARRTLIAGKLPNTRDNLVAWIRAPQRIDPASAMPSMGVSQGDALDMAAYLAHLD